MIETLAFAQAAEIEASLELFAERCGDPTPLVYGRLFAAHPQMQPYFWRDTDGAIKGEMLSRTFEAILDFVGPRRYADHMIATEMVTHEGYDVPREVFVTFFGVIRDTARAALGADWTAAFEDAWSRLIEEIGAYVGVVPRSDVENSYYAGLRDRFERGEPAGG
jgi:hypothetical protein